MPTGQYKRKPRGNYRDPVDGFFNKIKLEENHGCWVWQV
jgi:hypothetical protein